MSYNETHRPQFHFTSQKYWLNDPNGLVYYDGEYHLFFQHNPQGLLWGNMTWGHAVSPDMLHWTQLEHALYPDELGTIFSGSAIIDWKNTSGLGKNKIPPMIAFYTSAGTGPVPFTQSIAFSNDRGRSWEKYRNNPILNHVIEENRDPKVIWDKEHRQWLMALYLTQSDYAIYGSKNLLKWEPICKVELPGVSECPDIFQLPLNNNHNEKYWIFWGASGSYVLGSFKNRSFVCETELIRTEWGPNGYAAQTWSDIPDEDGRRLQISWMRGGKYPAMPFNQQMSFPVELSLKTTPEGIRLCRQPIREISNLYIRDIRQSVVEIREEVPFIPPIKSELLDVNFILDMGNAHTMSIKICGKNLVYRRNTSQLSFDNTTVNNVDLRNNTIYLRFLVDRTSIELFLHEGDVTLSQCFLPEAANHILEFCSTGGDIYLTQLNIHTLRSTWF